MIKTITSRLGLLKAVSANVALDLANGKDQADKIRLIRESDIFDLDFYRQQLEDNSLGLNAAIVHYLNNGVSHNIAPHPLFDTAFYISANSDIDFKKINPFIHFIIEGGKSGRSPHPLFDAEFYINEYWDVRRSQINPLIHYMKFGAAEGRSPSGTFDTRRYKKKVQKADLRQYLSGYLKAYKKINFLRSVKTTTFVIGTSRFAAIQSCLARRQNLLLYFLSEGVQSSVFPFPSFELLFELMPRAISAPQKNRKNSSKNYWRIVPRDLKTTQTLPLRYAKFAAQVAATNLTKEKSELFKELVQSITFKKNTDSFLTSNKTVVLFSHVASLTGAPLLLLQIARGLVADGWECLLFLEREGELEEEFSEIAHVINFQESMGRERKCEQYMSLLFDDFKFKKPKIALLNSLETGGYVKAMRKNGLKIISLVHELVDTYRDAFLHDIFELSDLAIFPAKFVRDFAKNKVGDVLERCPQVIMPNALLNTEFGSYDKSRGRELLREEINAPKNALVVLGCGAPEMRKGFDLFVLAARIVNEKWSKESDKYAGRPVHFVWVGADEISPFSPHYYVSWDIKQSDIDSYVHLLPSRKDLRPVFHGADLFVLPSRKDPFPCVVQDAMAAQLPIVSFANAGGVPEMIEGGGAQIVPYGDIAEFSQAIEYYLKDDTLREAHGRLNAKLVSEKFRFSDYMDKLQEQINVLIR